MNVISFDPGAKTKGTGTTGIAYALDLDLNKAMQGQEIQVETSLYKGGAIYRRINTLLTRMDWDVVIIENYRIYKKELEHHVWDEVRTARIIGALEYVCKMERIPIVMQGAYQIKDRNYPDDLTIKGRNVSHTRDAWHHLYIWYLGESPLYKKLKGVPF